MTRFRLLSNVFTQDTRAIILRSLFWAGILVLVVISIIPRDHLPPLGFDMWDKLQHVLAYTILSVLGVQAYPGKKYLAAIFFGLVILGGCLEVIQSIVPNRESSFGDEVANTIGVGIGLIIVRGLSFFFRVKK